MARYTKVVTIRTMLLKICLTLNMPVVPSPGSYYVLTKSKNNKGVVPHDSTIHYQSMLSMDDSCGISCKH